MISKDCKDCEMLNTENEGIPCDLEQYGSYLRCNILKEYVENHKITREDI